MTQTLPLTHFSDAPSASNVLEQSAQPHPCMKSTEILRGQKAIEITHNGAIYKLQATRLGKLILTK